MAWLDNRPKWTWRGNRKCTTSGWRWLVGKGCCNLGGGTGCRSCCCGSPCPAVGRGCCCRCCHAGGISWARGLCSFDRTFPCFAKLRIEKSDRKYEWIYKIRHIKHSTQIFILTAPGAHRYCHKLNVVVVVAVVVAAAAAAVVEEEEEDWVADTLIPHFVYNFFRKLVSLLVNWCFQPSQKLGILSGLKETFIKRWI